MEVETKQPKNKYNLWIWIISIVVPVAVAVLFTVRIPGVERMGFLPPIYATINALTAVILIISVIQIKKGNRKNHEFLMKTAILLSLLFLLLYIAYHMTSDSTKYGGDGIVKYLYYFILITHIMLSITVIPFVLITYVRAITGKFEKHKAIARITFPLWLYVAITGVIVYVMISPYY
jgi:putative membrane protein|tara:strand:+ start:1552 stop:2082 length:531 start_codon:yes stop_codon:yes gene_type:complete